MSSSPSSTLRAPLCESEDEDWTAVEHPAVRPLELSQAPVRRSRLKLWTKWAYLVSAGALLLVICPAVVYSLASHNEAARKFLLPLAASFVCCAVPVSFFGIYSHVTNYWQPTLQKYVVRIIWMVPVYSVTSLAELCLWLRVESGHPKAAQWCVVPRAARDCYESYTVLNFFYFMLAFLEMTDGAPAEAVVKNLTPSGKRRRRKCNSSSTTNRGRGDYRAVAINPLRDNDDHADDDHADADDDHAVDAVEHGATSASSPAGGERDLDDLDDDDSSDSSSDSSSSSSSDEARAVRHPCPPYSCFCASWRLDSGEFLERAKYGVLLYATLMPLCALALILNAIVLSQTGGRDDSSVTDLDDDLWSQAYGLLTPANVAAFIQFNAANHAIYCLAIFYYVAHHLLAPCHPHLKFVAVKGIVFGTFFQNLGIDAVFYAKPSLAKGFSDGSDVDAALGSVQSTLMCVEMLAFALLHAKAFPVNEFPRVHARPPPVAALRSTHPGRRHDDDLLLDDDDLLDDDAKESDDDDDDMDRTKHVSDKSRQWLAAWGDFYAEQRAEQLIRPSRVIFDVSDVHRDTSGMLSGLHRDVTTPILSDRSSSVFARTLARLRASRQSTTVAFARFASSRAGRV